MSDESGVVNEEDDGVIQRVFVACDDDTFLCEDCLPPDLDLGDPEVEVWEEYSSGWIAPVICRECKLSIPVYVDAAKPEEKTE